MDTGQLAAPMRRDTLSSRFSEWRSAALFFLVVALGATSAHGQIISIEGQKHLRIGHGRLDLTLALSPEGTLSDDQVTTLLEFLRGLRRIEQELVSRTLFRTLDVVYQGPRAPLVYEELTKNVYNEFLRLLVALPSEVTSQPNPHFPLLARDTMRLLRFVPLEHEYHGSFLGGLSAKSGNPKTDADRAAVAVWDRLGDFYRLMHVKLAAHPPAGTADLERLWADFPRLVAQSLADKSSWSADNRRIFFQALLDGTAPHLRDQSAQETLRRFAREQNLSVTFAAPRRGPLFE